MNFTNNRYEKMMKQRPPAHGPVCPESAQGLPVRRVPLLARHPLYGLLPGAFENP